MRIRDVPAFWSLDGAELFVLPDDRLIGVTLATGASRVVDRLPRDIMWPALSPDGKVACLLGARGKQDSTRVMAVDINAAAGLSVGIPRVLFTAVLMGSNPLRSWDVTADGSRFVIVQPIGVQSPPGDVHLMVNWFPKRRRLFNRAGVRP